ncbi:MAG: aminomethyl-transferring glycine dehydrogenase subunit GcvPB [Alphaproteobacteria bacterium]|jgi:glycine dehydrogenase subunit 2|nr:glycine dehydrogenase (aminomethyl-transferring) [Rhodospirillaceae bacterium]MDP6403649.1 aminomethyl-transferring glycine dehydrogenase subunit GcvPB [Alphaproteobacteria bacterium]MDP6623237.1 aminomethyl-transferring glycine dehydrogenase subunit GcvPB [Alphaproteobacteria bacterium]
MTDRPQPETASRRRALDHEEPLIFELGAPGRMGVDLPEPENFSDRLGDLSRSREIGLPGLSEPQVVRHFVRLSRNNYSIDAGLYPLGSCTMKHNPRLNEKLARLPGFAELHPLQPAATTQGALALIDAVGHWLKVITGLPGIAMSPAAGAHGELCGLMTIRRALEARGDARSRVLVPDSAHGTNPATAAMCGYAIDAVPGNARGRIDLEALKAKLDDDVAAVMLTNPNTCGLFEDQVLEVAEAIHGAGGFFYCDGANLNAIMGRTRPGDLGVDAMHINLHKTFSTPHGGGGPGAGPVVLSEALVPFAPLPWVVEQGEGFALVEHAVGEAAQSLGRMRAFHGQMGMFVRAYAYMLSLGAEGLRQVSEDAVLAANYLLAELDGDLTPSFPGPCMHEVLFDERFLKDTGVTTLDYAKALIDEGFHPMTIYFPLVVHGALLTEPTESESKESLDQLIAAMRRLVQRARSGDTEFFQMAPRHAPRRRIDETRAARNPVLRWRPPGKDQPAE